MTTLSQSGTYIYNANVNGGVAVKLYDSQVTFDYKRNVSGEPVPGKQTSNRYEIVTLNRCGISNPAITITGSIDIEITETDMITEKLLKDFWRDVTGDTYLTIGAGNIGTEESPSVVGISNYKGTYDTNAGTANNIKIEITGVNFTITAATERGHFISYTINATESV